MRLFRNPDEASAEELECDLSALPQWQREKDLSYKFLNTTVGTEPGFVCIISEKK